MLDAGIPVWWVVGLVALVVLGWFALNPREARVERRRRRNHNRIIAKGDRPMVKLSVRPPKEK